MSVLSIAREIGVDAKTIRTWKVKLGIGTDNDRSESAIAAAQGAATASAAMAAPLPLPGDPEALVLVRGRHDLIQGLLRSLEQAVIDESYPATSFVTLARYGDDLARLIATLTPPAPRDPDTDPDVLEAESALLARLERLVSEREGK